MYVEYSIDWLHGKSVLDFYDEEVDVLLVWLQEIDRIVALADEDLIVFVWDELGIMLMIDSGVLELEGGIY